MKTYVLFNDMSYWYHGEKQNVDDIQVSGPPPEDGSIWFWNPTTNLWEQ